MQQDYILSLKYPWSLGTGQVQVIDLEQFFREGGEGAYLNRVYIYLLQAKRGGSSSEEYGYCVYCVNGYSKLFSDKCMGIQGLQSNFEIGGTLLQYWGGHKTLFLLLTLYNFKNIACTLPPQPSLLHGPWNCIIMSAKSLPPQNTEQNCLSPPKLVNFKPKF